MVEYRNIKPEDEGAVFDLWAHTWGVASGEVVSARARADDPLYLQHIFVAAEPDGTVLAAWRYLPRLINDAEGRPRQVGCVASVVTVEHARRQGHARRLVQLGHEAMRGEGLDWAFLFSSRMGVPLYTSIGYSGYSMPFHKGRLSGARPQATGEYAIERLDPPFYIESDALEAVRRIYGEYNARRPLSLMRDDRYWRNRFSRRMDAGIEDQATALFLARNDKEATGYLIAHYSTREVAREKFNLDQVFTLSEIGFLGGHEGAAADLLNAALDAVPPGEVEGTSVLPREEPLESYVRLIFGDSLYMFDDRRMMGFPLGGSFTREEMDRIFAAPGSLSWLMDDF
ncbi:MAG TPA: GNAT family N-acetyltransferase [Chloroflexia bacterium]|nr:GNAT family N-acetyltransferase [Chloroflexia bacterium]